ncbi:MAG: hypothetical protein Tp136SUR676911_33 [Prokaryotic dsDNA virus sp.]|jgi:hypothetical protein|nr:MAG: hypothetical protein Tp136SUR676911_33 [Prokaryotic dsDNA virus sp.]|tara:strand:- start:18083 stop:19567 length:1485 start_codon:yes stop_codon:yes gene_type:complete
MTIFPTGTATFTNGSKSVTNVSLSSGTLAFFDKGTQVKVESDPVLDIVEADKATSGNSFSLAEAWPHATGTYNFYATMTAEGIRSLADALKTATLELDTFKNSVSVSPVADSFVKRDSRGAVKTANAVDADDAVALGQTGTAYSRDVGTGGGDVMEVGAFGLGGSQAYPDINSPERTSFGYYGDGTQNLPVPNIGGFTFSQKTQQGTEQRLSAQIHIPRNNEKLLFRHSDVNQTTQNTADWRDVWHDYNLPDPARLGQTNTWTGYQQILSRGMTNGASFINSAIRGSLTSAVENSGRFAVGLPTSPLDNYGVTIAAHRYQASGTPQFEVRLHNGSESGDLLMRGNASEGLVVNNKVTADSLNVTGSKNFRIDNPANPDEYLYHSAIESDKPRTQYILEIDVDATLEATHAMPDWFHGLNGNTCTVFCSPCKHFGQAYGEVTDGVLTLTANQAGRYHVLVMAERSDPNVANWLLTEPKPVEEDNEQSDKSTEQPQ